jgi:hypothetical protein
MSDAEITLNTIFSDHSEPEGEIKCAGGKIIYEIQQKIPHLENQYIKLKPELHFLIVPELEILILHGVGTIRVHLLDIIEQALGGGSTLELLKISKTKMDKLVEKIRTQDLRNRVAVQKDEQIRVNGNDGIEANIFKMHKGLCASKVKKITDDKKTSSSYDCKLGIVKCNGLLDTPISDEITLTITKNAEFSLSTDKKPEQWNRFILEQCKIIV